MRIAYFTDTFSPQVNGVVNTLDKLGAYLVKNNIEHMFFAPEYADNTLKLDEKHVRRFKSVPFIPYPECRLSIPIYSNLRRIADRFRPDLVHITTPLGIGLSGLRYARERGIPVVSSFHTNFDMYLKYYGLEYFYDALWHYFKWFHNFSAVNFCPSEDTRKMLAGKGIENLKIWSRGVDTERFNPNCRDEALRDNLGKDGKKIFLYAGRLAAEKDLDTLMQSIEIINASHPGSSTFVLAGDGPQADSLKQSAPENVLFPGYLRGAALSAMYASCDAFVFPSGTETFGNVVLEAMASGLPAIVVNSGGVTDSVLHGYNGFISLTRDAESFAESIVRLLENESLICEMGGNARAYAVTKSWDSVFDTLISDCRTAVEEALENRQLNFTA